MKLAIFANSGESLLLNGSGTELDTVQYRRVENVDTGVNAVSNELDGLFYKAVDARRVIGLMNDDTIL